MEAELGDTSPSDHHHHHHQQQRRSICVNCDRPLGVCLCHVIPSPSIPTTTHIIIVQHPHESRHRLNTTPLLTRSLLNTTTIITRRLPHPLLPNFHSSNTYYLFPSSPSIPLSEVKDSLKTSRSNDPLLLIVFDATWKHAREMVRKSEEYLSKFAIRVCLDGFDEEVEGGSIYDSELVLRKEPCGGCVSTLEAVARWLGAVEDDGPYVEGRLVGVLKEMVRLQAQFLKPIKPRPKLLKRNKCVSDLIRKFSSLNLLITLSRSMVMIADYMLPLLQEWYAVGMKVVPTKTHIDALCISDVEEQVTPSAIAEMQNGILGF